MKAAREGIVKLGPLESRRRKLPRPHTPSLVEEVGEAAMRSSREGIASTSVSVDDRGSGKSWNESTNDRHPLTDAATRQAQRCRHWPLGQSLMQSLLQSRVQDKLDATSQNGKPKAGAVMMARRRSHSAGARVRGRLGKHCEEL
ncbi:hypothetical protein E4U53_007131 [Claviceps sorghi]|nr:hypothetical protein E4U53_007131 [Claviceps sorghi]